MTKPKNSAGNVEIQRAQDRMRGLLKARWSEHRSHFDDWIQDATIKWLERPAVAPEQHLERVAKDRLRTQKRRSKALNSSPPDAEIVDIAPMLEARSALKLETAPPVTATISLAGEGLVEITDDDLKSSKLNGELGSLASLWWIASEKDGATARMRAVADVLIALSDDKFDPTSIAKRARAWNEANYLGPEPRTRQADAFIATVATREAREIVHRLSALPALSRLITAPLWPEPERERARRLVTRVMATETDQRPESLAKAILRALGCSAQEARKLDQHRAKAKSRERRRRS